MTSIKDIQQVIGVTPDGIWGPGSQKALDAILHPPAKPPTWPFSIQIVGDDIVVNDILITSFGGWGTGIADPQDNGNTASGVNTKTRPIIGISIAMDGRQFSTLGPAEHRALDGAPIPRLLNEHGLTAWHTQVEVTIGSLKFIPRDGLVDLGPGLQATPTIKGMRDPKKAHALDLTPLAAAYFKAGESVRNLALDFEARGSFRIIGGARLIGAIA